MNKETSTSAAKDLSWYARERERLLRSSYDVPKHFWQSSDHCSGGVRGEAVTAASGCSPAWRWYEKQRARLESLSVPSPEVVLDPAVESATGLPLPFSFGAADDRGGTLRTNSSTLPTSASTTTGGLPRLDDDDSLYVSPFLRRRLQQYVNGEAASGRRRSASSSDVRRRQVRGAAADPRPFVGGDSDAFSEVHPRGVVDDSSEDSDANDVHHTAARFSASAEANDENDADDGENDGRSGVGDGDANDEVALSDAGTGTGSGGFPGTEQHHSSSSAAAGRRRSLPTEAPHGPATVAPRSIPVVESFLFAPAPSVLDLGRLQGVGRENGEGASATTGGGRINATAPMTTTTPANTSAAVPCCASPLQFTCVSYRPTSVVVAQGPGSNSGGGVGGSSGSAASGATLTAAPARASAAAAATGEGGAPDCGNDKAKFASSGSSSPLLSTLLVCGTSSGSLLFLRASSADRADAPTASELVSAHSGAVLSLSWSIHGHLLSLGSDCTAIIHDTVRLTKLRLLCTERRPCVGRFLAGNANIVVLALEGSSNLHLYNVSTGLVVRKVDVGLPATAIAAMQAVIRPNPRETCSNTTGARRGVGGGTILTSCAPLPLPPSIATGASSCSRELMMVGNQKGQLLFVVCDDEGTTQVFGQANVNALHRVSGGSSVVPPTLDSGEGKSSGGPTMGIGAEGTPKQQHVAVVPHTGHHKQVRVSLTPRSATGSFNVSNPSLAPPSTASSSSSAVTTSTATCGVTQLSMVALSPAACRTISYSRPGSWRAATCARLTEFRVIACTSSWDVLVFGIACLEEAFVQEPDGAAPGREEDCTTLVCDSADGGKADPAALRVLPSRTKRGSLRALTPDSGKSRRSRAKAIAFEAFRDLDQRILSVVEAVGDSILHPGDASFKRGSAVSSSAGCKTPEMRLHVICKLSCVPPSPQAPPSLLSCHASRVSRGGDALCLVVNSRIAVPEAGWMFITVEPGVGEDEDGTASSPPPPVVNLQQQQQLFSSRGGGIEDTAVVKRLVVATVVTVGDGGSGAYQHRVRIVSVLKAVTIESAAAAKTMLAVAAAWSPEKRFVCVLLSSGTLLLWRRHKVWKNDGSAWMPSDCAAAGTPWTLPASFSGRRAGARGVAPRNGNAPDDDEVAGVDKEWYDDDRETQTALPSEVDWAHEIRRMARRGNAGVGTPPSAERKGGHGEGPGDDDDNEEDDSSSTRNSSFGEPAADSDSPQEAEHAP